jgi:predicted GNAT family acetyltransferase
MSVRDNPDKSRYEIYEGDELAAFVEYHLHADVIAFLHTETLEGFGGRGLASQLARETLDDARRRGLRVQPFCPFVRAFIKKHVDEYVDLVPEAERARFDLVAA